MSKHALQLMPPAANHQAPPRCRRLAHLQCLAWMVLVAACSTQPGRPPVASAPPPEAPSKSPAATAAPLVPKPPVERSATPSPPAIPVAPPAAAIAVDEPDPSTNVFFAAGTLNITPDGLATLGEFSRKLKADHRLKVLLIGHADESGSTEYCVAVAAKRTSAVKAGLMKLGVPVRQIRRRALGCEPTARDSCAADACGRAKRRVELLIVEPEKPRTWPTPRKK